MSSAHLIANNFIVEFFECFAKNPSQLAEFYGSNSCLTFNDFELGLRELLDAEVPRAAVEYAETLQGSQLRVDSVNAAPLHSGVSVFAIVSAQSEAQQQYFHFTTVLEAYPSGFGLESYFIRHQIIARIGAIAQEAQPEPAAPVEEPKEVEASAPAPAAAAPKAKTPEPEPAVVEEPVPEEEEAAPAPAPAAAPATPTPAPAAKPAKAAAAPAAPAPSGPKSWASIAKGKKAADAKQVVRVVAQTEKDKAPAAAAVAASAPAAAAKEAPKRVRKQAVGDRLMFNIDSKVTDEEIHQAFGPVAASIVSLRNNSEKGNVFVDFAEGVDAMEELKNASPVLGEQKTKIVIRRQRERAERQQQ